MKAEIVLTKNPREQLQGMRDRFCYPHAVPHGEKMQSVVVGIAAKRLLGRELSKIRPNLSLMASVDDVLIRVFPELKASPTGWFLSGKVFLTIKCAINQSTYNLKFTVDKFGKISHGFYKRDIGLNESFVDLANGVIDVLANDPESFIRWLDVDHCGCCGRSLVDEESRSFGIGPECIKSIGFLRNVDNENIDDFMAEIKTIKSEMQHAHPDKGGDHDAFIVLKNKLSKLRAYVFAKTSKS